MLNALCINEISGDAGGEAKPGAASRATPRLAPHRHAFHRPSPPLTAPHSAHLSPAAFLTFMWGFLAFILFLFNFFCQTQTVTFKKINF